MVFFILSLQRRIKEQIHISIFCKAKINSKNNDKNNKEDQAFWLSWGLAPPPTSYAS